MRVSKWWASALVWCAFAAGAAAQTPQRVVVLDFEGRAGNAARKHVVAALSEREDVELVSERTAQQAASRLGTSLGTADSYVAVARDLEVAAFVEGEVTRRGGRWVARVRIRDARTGQVVGTEPWARKKPAQLKAIRGNFWQILGPDIMRCEAPSPVDEDEDEDEPEPVAAAPTVVDEPEPETPAPREQERAPRDSSVRPTLSADVLTGFLWRNLDYSDGDANLRSYRNGFGNPGIPLGVETEYYPGGHFTASRWADLGMELDFDYVVGLSSNDNGEKLGTTAWDMLAGAVFRLPIDVFVPKLHLDYVKQVFAVDGDPDVVLLPDVAYSGLRISVSFAVTLADLVEIEFGLGYIQVFNAGQVHGDRYFPEGTAAGVDFESSLVYYIKPWVGLTLGADWRRFAHDFRADPSFVQEGPSKLAGGAIDRYVKFDLGVRFRLNPREP